ncbi:MAG TPA: hypothetical protein VGP19_14205 [Candidatus Acidoferrales bacterium]|jgi:hypothetical protein|nr:hypothetical protein [Candidatus Acidoferrales bacterium]
MQAKDRSWGRVAALAVLCAACVGVGANSAHAAPYYVTVSGLGGEPDYEQRFAALAKDLDKLFKAAASDAHVYTLTGSDATKARLSDALGQIAREAKPEDEFTLILIGHGSYDGEEYKFNLPGPDISGEDLALLCDRIPAKRQLIVNTTSASGGSIGALQKAGRIVIAATKTGTEKNATVFARYWVDALRDGSADTDKNESISALEAFQYADRKTAAFYESQKRLATEHAVIEDTGKKEAVRAASAENGEGLLAANFVLLRIGAAQKAANDPAKRGLLDKKEELERKIDLLKYQKAAMSAEDYKSQLSAALLELARVQGDLDK